MERCLNDYSEMVGASQKDGEECGKQYEVSFFAKVFGIDEIVPEYPVGKLDLEGIERGMCLITG